MKKYFNISLMMALFAMFTLCFTACSSDDDDDEKSPAPTITIKEANIEEGDIVCVQADVEAKGRTAAIKLTISGKDGKEKVSQPVPIASISVYSTSTVSTYMSISRIRA